MKYINIILIVLLPLIIICCKSNKNNTQIINPSNLEECFLYFNSNLSKEDIKLIKNSKENELSKFHFGLGLWIRNSWLKGGRNGTLIKYFNNLGIYHPDDMSGIIITSYWRYLNNKPLKLKKQINYYLDYWEKMEKIQIENEQKTKTLFKRFEDSYIDTYFFEKNTPVMRLPDREYSYGGYSANNYIKYNNGLIINSIKVYDNKNTEIIYKYLYFDLNSHKFYKLKFSPLDTIESIIRINDTLYITGFQNKEHIIYKFNNKQKEKITIKNLDKTNWFKLFAIKEKLLLLSENNIYAYEDSWLLLKSFNRDELIFPTNDLLVNNNILYFIQENHGGYHCDLYFLDLFNPNSDLVEFWENYNLVNNYSRAIYSFHFKNDNLWISSEILMGNHYLFTISNGEIYTYVYKNKIKNNTKINILSGTILNYKEKILLIASNGLFQIDNNYITPLIYIENYKQLIPTDSSAKHNYHFNFTPKSAFVIDEKNILVSGIYDGIYLISANNPGYSIEWLDKTSYKHLQYFELK